MTGRDQAAEPLQLDALLAQIDDRLLTDTEYRPVYAALMRWAFATPSSADADAAGPVLAYVDGQERRRHDFFIGVRCISLIEQRPGLWRRHHE